MSNSTTNLDLLSATQAQKEAVANAMFDAASPSMLWGRRASTTGGLTWGFFGGWFAGAQIANGTLTLTASATNYVYANSSTGAVSVNTTGFPTSGAIPLYVIVTGTTTVTSYTDERNLYAGGGGGSTYVPAEQLMGAAIQTAAYTMATGDRGNCLVMNSSSAVSQSLPTATGSTGNFPNGWFGYAENIGAGTMTLGVPSGAKLDGVTNGTLALATSTGIGFFTDGSNWYTIRGMGLGNGTLAGLSDVSISSPTSGQSLTYNGSKWVNTTGGSGGMTNPMTTAGDIIVGGSSGTPARVGIGSTGQVLTVAGGTAVWQTPGSPAVGTPTVVQKASSVVSGATATLTLGSAPTPGNLLVVLAGGYSGSGTNFVPYTFSTTGWQMVTATIGSNEQAAAYVRTVQSGDAASFTVTSGNSAFGAAVYEVSGAGVAIGSAVAAAAPATSGGTTTGQPIPAWAANTLALCLFENDTGSATGALSSGWTLDYGSTASGNSFHTIAGGHYTASAAGTVAGATITWSGSATNQVVPALTVALQPSGLTNRTPPSIVQQHYSGGNSPLAATLTATPTVGNLLLAFIGGYATSSSSTPLQNVSQATPPDHRWTLLGQFSYGLNEYISVWSRPVISGDGTSYTWTNVNANSMTVQMYEIANAGGISVTGDSLNPNPASSTGTSVGASGNAPCANCLAFSFVEQDIAATGSLSTGWTQDTGGFSGYGHQLVGGHLLVGPGPFAAPTITWTNGNTGTTTNSPSATVCVAPVL